MYVLQEGFTSSLSTLVLLAKIRALSNSQSNIDVDFYIVCSVNSNITTLFCRTRAQFNRFSSNFRQQLLLPSVSIRHAEFWLHTLHKRRVFIG